MFEKEKLTKAEKLARVVELADEAVSADDDFQADAKDDFNFRNGNQWPSEEKKKLADNQRPCLTFNLTKSSIDLVMGLNEDQKVRYRVVPTNKEDTILADIVNKIVYRVREEGEWDQEEDDAFESMAICGRGWVALDFTYDPKRFGYIKLEETSVPIHEVFKDPGSRRKDLADASYIIWERWMTAEDFMIKYPNAKNNITDAFDTGFMWRTKDVLREAQLPYADDFVDEVDMESDYDVPLDTNWYDKSKRMVRVVHMEYWKSFDRYYVKDPVTKVVKEITQPWGQYKKWYKETFGEQKLEYTKLPDKKVYWLQFIRDEILYDGESPLDFDGFSIIPSFAYIDTSKRTPSCFGIVRLMKDAQLEVNKRWSQMLNMVVNQVQPGVFAETDAFIDRDQAEQSMKTPGETTYVEKGALSGQRILERKVPDFPTAIMHLEEAAQIMLKRITGINPDLHGQDAGRAEPGVVVRLRQQQGLVILKPLFKAYKIMRKELYKRIISLVLRYMPVEQMQEIIGRDEVYSIASGPDQEPIIVHNETGEQVPLMNVKKLAYHLELEETSDSTTQRTFELSMLLEMQQGGFTVDPLAVIEKLDISASDKERWTKYIAAQQEAASQQANNQFQLEAQKLEMQHMREMERMRLSHEQAMGKLILQAKRDIANDENEDAANQVDFIDAILRYKSSMAAVEGSQTETAISATVDMAKEMIKAKATKEKGDTKKNETGRNASKK